MVPQGKAERRAAPTEHARQDKRTRELEMPADHTTNTVLSPPAFRTMTFDLNRKRLSVGSVDLRANPVDIVLHILVQKGTVLAF